MDGYLINEIPLWVEEADRDIVSFYEKIKGEDFENIKQN